MEFADFGEPGTLVPGLSKERLRSARIAGGEAPLPVRAAARDVL